MNATFFAFDDPQRAIRILRPDTPQPWINYLSNGTFHAFVSQAGGGFCWLGSAVTRRLTRYRQYNLPLDAPGFYVYLRHADGTVWSPTWRPTETPTDEWSATHQPGRTTFRGRKNGVCAELRFFVAPDHPVLIWELALTNETGQEAALDLFSYAELSQPNWRNESPWGYYFQHHLETRWLADLETTVYFMRHTSAPFVWLASTVPVVGFDGDRSAFLGDYRSERNPVVVESGNCGNTVLPCGQPCAALQNKVRVAAGQTLRLAYFLGATRAHGESYDASIGQIREVLVALRAPGAVDAQRAKMEEWWEEHLGILRCEVPSAAARRMIETWTPVNSVHTGRYSRAVNTWAPGIRGVGFRDTCQDMLAVAYRKPDWATRVFHFLLGQQYEDGHVVHYCYPEEGDLPTTSIHCDDHLWLPFVAYAVAAETGDLAFLQQPIPFLGPDHKTATGSATAWEHLMAAIRFTESQLGDHRMPLILRSDWNDIIGKFSEKGRGESVFAAQQYVAALADLVALAESLGDEHNRAWLLGCRQRMTEAILACAWDGGWWRRAFDDNGQPVGSLSSPFGNLWLNSQSWAVLSGVGTPEQHRTALQAVAERLDTGVGLKKLDPGFKTWPDVEDPFAAYCPGTGENGAIFCHANTWAIMAEALLGNGTRAWKYFLQLVPELAMEKVGADRYRAEPYAWVSNIVGPENPRFGWANVEQITGTASWMDIAATQYLLGLRPTLAGLLIDPCIPREWQGFAAERVWRGCRLQIRVENPFHIEKGVSRVFVDGKEVERSGKAIITPARIAGRRTLDVRVVMG